MQQQPKRQNESRRNAVPLYPEHPYIRDFVSVEEEEEEDEDLIEDDKDLVYDDKDLVYHDKDLVEEHNDDQEYQENYINTGMDEDEDIRENSESDTVNDDGQNMSMSMSMSMSMLMTPTRSERPPTSPMRPPHSKPKIERTLSDFDSIKMKLEYTELGSDNDEDDDITQQ